ncbi:hypothetical protein ACWENO_04930 [Streptomyces sp. NPDC004436]
MPYSRLDSAVRLLAAEPAVRQLAVTSGPTTLLGYSSHRTVRDFHHFATRVFRGLDQVTASDTALLMGDYKRAGIPGPAGCAPFSGRPRKRVRRLRRSRGGAGSRARERYPTTAFSVVQVERGDIEAARLGPMGSAADSI